MADGVQDFQSINDMIESRGAQAGQARSTLMRGLVDTVATPSSSIPAPDRNMAGDILLHMLLALDDEDRALAAKRLKVCSEAPRRLLRYLAHSPISIGGELLAENEGFDATDLVMIAREGGLQHREIIAGRKYVPFAVSDVIADFAEPSVIEILLRNEGAEISESCVDKIVVLSRDDPQFCELLTRRSELTAAQAMAMFWWSDPVLRRNILQRYAGDRNEIIERCAPTFRIIAENAASDAVTLSTLSLIERRQRNREALANSKYDSLEAALDEAALKGMTAELAQEIGYLAGIKPVTIGKILTDRGGEGIAVLCKATGLKRPYLAQFWTALKRPLEDETGGAHPSFERVSETFEVLSVGRAQTTLRYWNWSLASALTAVSTGLGGGGALDATYGSSLDLAKLAFED